MQRATIGCLRPWSKPAGLARWWAVPGCHRQVQDGVFDPAVDVSICPVLALRVSFVIVICCPDSGVLQTLLGSGDASFFNSD